MKRPKHIIFYLIFISLISCDKSQNNRFEIYGYSLGDSINNDIEIIQTMDYPWSKAKFKNDDRIELFLVYNHINQIFIEDTSKLFDLLSPEKISRKTRIIPDHYTDSSKFGLKIKGEEYYWFDSISNDEIFLWINNKMNLYTYNKRIFDSLYQLSGAPMDTTEFEFTNID